MPPRRRPPVDLIGKRRTPPTTNPSTRCPPRPPTEEGHHRETSGRIGAESPQTTAERNRAARGVGATPHETSVTVKGTTNHRPIPPPRRHGRLLRPSTTRRRNHLPGAAAPPSTSLAARAAADQKTPPPHQAPALTSFCRPSRPCGDDAGAFF
jgi:hypothetical protein